ncbi:hypothetical protein FOL46_002179 [Perkinsus olseni]|uniref:Ubiquitin-conjugating enzyme E2 G1 n=1 Tax=Perkinsus olseni TaxID=32597 RepID=A0A7J6M8X2_PEROL|nr:hypothetical protein FOL46_002179 [Perkinsus olseni]
MSVARELLKKQLIELTRDDSCGFSVGLEDDSDFFKWRVCFEGPPDSLYEGGLFSAILQFPEDFPNNPPAMRFETPMWHPNVYPDGRVCISILHPPGTDQFNELESADERWRPILSVESILVSVISMLASPNLDSPANVDAAVEFKKDYPAYKKKVRRLGQLLMAVSQEDLDEWIEVCEEKCDRIVLLMSVRGQQNRPGLGDRLLGEWERLKDRVRRAGGDAKDLETVDLELLEFLRESIHGLHELPASDYRRLCLESQECFDRLIARGWSTSSVSRMYSCGMELSSVMLSFIKGQLRQDLAEGKNDGLGKGAARSLQKRSTRGKDVTYFSPTTEKIDFTGIDNVDESERYSWDLVLDAEWVGNEGRFANHADDPNASFILKSSRDACPDNPMAEHDSLPVQCMSLVATKPIRRKQEILVHYGPTYWDNVMNSEPSLTEERRMKISRTSWQEGFSYYDGVLLDGGFVTAEGGCHTSALREALLFGEFRTVPSSRPCPLKPGPEKGISVVRCEENHPAYPGYKLVATKDFRKGDFICVYGGVIRRNNAVENKVLEGRYQMDIIKRWSGAFGFQLDENLEYFEVQFDLPVFSPRADNRKVLKGGPPSDLSKIKKINILDRPASRLLCDRLQQPEWWDVIIDLLEDADNKSPKMLSKSVRNRLAHKHGDLPPAYPREVVDIDLDSDDD